MRGNLDYQIKRIWHVLDGIGTSKALARKKSSVKNIDESMHVSNMVHSYEYKDEVLRTARDIGRFALKQGVRDLSTISFEIIDRWFTEKLDRDVSRDTLRNYLSHIIKIQLAFEQIAIEEKRFYCGYTKKDLTAIHNKLKELEKNGYSNRAYQNPGAVVSNLEGKEYLVGVLQYRYGLRVSEASHIRENQLDGHMLTVQGKGGYIQKKELETSIAEKLLACMEEGIFHVSQNRYRKNLEESARVEGEAYYGTHGLRYNYAQALYFDYHDQNIANGLPFAQAHKKALVQTSQEIGHHRGEITLRYIG